MALIKCNECGKEVSDKAATCPNCGAPVNSQVDNQEDSQDFQAYQGTPVAPLQKPKKKTGCGCLVFIVVFIAIVVIAIIAGTSELNYANIDYDEPEITSANNTSIDVMFDATKYYNIEGEEKRLLIYDEVKEKMGEPESEDDYNYYISETRYYPIHIMIYNGLEFNFAEDKLIRITWYGEVEYDDDEELLKKFGLKKFKNSTKVATGKGIVRYEDVGVAEFFATGYSGEELIIHITYSDGVFTD